MLSALTRVSARYPFIPNHIATKQVLNSTVRFAQAESGPNKMDPKKESSDPESKTVDTMSSMGEGYATRSDEEGFGGIYGGNQYLNKDKNTAAEMEHTQGSEVKEKEKARNQEKIPTHES